MLFSPEYWSRLSDHDKKLLIPKLILSEPKKYFSPLEINQAKDVFWNLIEEEGSRERTEDKFLTLRNFTRQVGKSEASWHCIIRFIGVSRSYLELRVHDCDEFLGVLRREKYAVNSWHDRIAKLVGKGHPFDSARALTENRFQPQLHFVNDRGDEEGYGRNYFFVHWDAQSVYARKGGFISKFAASQTHEKFGADPRDVKKMLDI
jgi:hypothetical protein